MTITGRTSWAQGLPRAYVSGFVLSRAGVWRDFWFRLDTGSDITCLPASAAARLNLSLDKPVESDDLAGVGSPSLQHVPYATALSLECPGVGKRFHGQIAVFAKPEDLDEPVLGMDVLQAFALVLDVPGDRVVLTDEMVRIASSAS